MIKKYNEEAVYDVDWEGDETKKFWIEKDIAIYYDDDGLYWLVIETWISI